MFKTSISQPHTTANKLDNSGGSASGGANVDGFGSRSIKKLFKSRKSTIPGNKKATEEPKFLISDARGAFNLLQQAFTKVSILRHFDPERHIRI